MTKTQEAAWIRYETRLVEGICEEISLLPPHIHNAAIARLRRVLLPLLYEGREDPAILPEFDRSRRSPLSTAA